MAKHNECIHGVALGARCPDCMLVVDQPVNRRCEDCKFSSAELVNGAPLLFCRARPPTCTPVIQTEAPSIRFPNGRQVQIMRSLWPAVAPGDWCYSFETRTLPPH